MLRLPLINVLLFLATLLSTVLAGAIMENVNPFLEPYRIYKGLPFALTLLTILSFHELGHYVVSRKRNVSCSLPYFIPVPPPISLLGTLGAFIKMKSMIRDRSVLIEIGVAGPMAGFSVSLIAILIGLNYSRVLEASPYAIYDLTFGSSLLFSLLTWIVLGVGSSSKEVIILHPVAFAGWIGFFITALNLLPAGQLDGGHVIYAFLGRRFAAMAKIVFLVLLALGFLWPGWFFWAAIILVLGFRHPALLDEVSPLSRKHKILALITGLILIGTFVPVPISI